jgi:hypothetical protein
MLLASLNFCLISCASITQGVSQAITFELNPTQTECLIYGSDSSLIATIVSTASNLAISKGSSDLLANCSADGYQTLQVNIKSSAQMIGIFGILIDFGITDMLTGAMWSYPDKIVITLTLIEFPQDTSSVAQK